MCILRALIHRLINVVRLETPWNYSARGGMVNVHTESADSQVNKGNEIGNSVELHRQRRHGFGM